MPGMMPADRDDYDLIPGQLIVRGKRTDDGIDISAVMQYRNRSRRPVFVQPLAAKFTLDGKEPEGRNFSGISSPTAPETSASIHFRPVRIYRENHPLGSARLVLMFGLSKGTMRTILDLTYKFRVLSYPEDTSVDAVLKTDLEESARYYAKKIPEGEDA